MFAKYQQQIRQKSIEFTRRNQLEHQIYFDQFSLIAPRERFPYAGNYNRLTTERQLNELQAGLLKDTGTIGPVTTSLLSVETVQIPNQSTIQTINSWLSSKTKETQQERTFYSGQPISKVIDMIHSIEKGHLILEAHLSLTNEQLNDTPIKTVSYWHFQSIRCSYAITYLGMVKLTVAIQQHNSWPSSVLVAKPNEHQAPFVMASWVISKLK